MPSLEKLSVELQSLEISRQYSNFGPLQELLRFKIAEHLGVHSDCVALLANATLAIEGALTVNPEKPESCYISAFTFPGAVGAAYKASKDLFFTDLDDEWRTIPKGNFGVDSLQFGDSVDIKNYPDNSQVLIDGAGSFDALENVGKVLRDQDGICISLHATKTFSAGEGGVFVSKNLEWVQKVRKWSNFGMWGDRNIDFIGTNGKLSEYHAAVGLASIKAWPETRNQFIKLSKRAKEISENCHFKLAPSINGERAISYWVIECENSLQKKEIVGILEKKRIPTRDWWGRGCHNMGAFKNVRKNYLGKTDSLVEKTIGLPFHYFLSESDFLRIEEALVETI
jgi:dTDP-4-amino-4,6-dideoxygalactose transaminase